MNKTKKFLAIAVCALTVVLAFALAGCGGVGKTDEQLIKEDIEKVVGTDISPEELVKEFKSDSDMKTYAEYGLDLDRTANALASKFKAEVGDIKVTGDKAVATVHLTTPTFGDEMEDLISKKMATLDVTGMTEDQVMKATMDILVDVFEDPSFPVVTEDIDIDYVKKGGKWQMEDEDAVDKALDKAMKI